MTKSEFTYLKCMYDFNKDYIRSIDVASSLNLSKVSVCVAMKKLTEKGYVEHEYMGYLRLTEKGRESIDSYIKSYDIMKKFLQCKLNANDEIAQNDAIEIITKVSNDTLNNILEKGEEICH